MKTTMLAVSLAGLLAPGLARAHDMWIERGKGAFVLRYGHRGGESLAIDAAKVKSLKCIAGGGPAKDVLGAASFSPKEVKAAAQCVAFSAVFYGGFFSLTPDGEKNLPKSQVPDAVKAWESKQFAKWVDARSPAAARIIGDELEIVPVTDLSQAKQGDKATYRVLVKGKPVSGAIAAIDHKPLGETDSAGEVRLRIRSASLEVVSATLRRRVSSPDADAQVFEASLSFEVAK
ncbi:MAG: DUF4198 domain-containing protein [Deltaproteobacteria bacterium]|nr:DUF4198 domain-containing protein [Deltaproteobacteria bacterium]